jgi:hypothetical protein
MLIQEASVEAAMKYLANTDVAIAQHKGNVKSLEYRLKVVKAVAFLSAEGTIAEREARSLASSEYSVLIDEYKAAVIDYETIAAKRERAVLTIEVWRSEESSRRKG